MQNLTSNAVINNEILLLKSILEDRQDDGFSYFNSWIDAKNFKGAFTYSEALYLPYLFIKYQTFLLNHPKHRLLEGLVKKNFLVNSILTDEIKKITQYIGSKHLQIVNIGESAIACHNNVEKHTRKIGRLTFWINAKDLMAIDILIKQLGYGLLEKQLNSYTEISTYHKNNNYTLNIYTCPIILNNQKQGEINQWFEKNIVNLNGIKSLNKEALLVQKILNLPLEREWYHIADILLLKKEQTQSDEILSHFTKITGTAKQIERVISNYQNKIKELKFAVEAKPNANLDFINFFLREGKVHQIGGRMAIYANQAGINSYSILNPIGWLRLIMIKLKQRLM
jgi:hypothetical protein